MHQYLKYITGIKFYMFRTVPPSIIRSFSLYTQQWYMSYRFGESCQKTCMTYTIAVCHPSDYCSYILAWFLEVTSCFFDCEKSIVYIYHLSYGYYVPLTFRPASFNYSNSQHIKLMFSFPTGC